MKFKLKSHLPIELNWKLAAKSHEFDDEFIDWNFILAEKLMRKSRAESESYKKISINKY